MISPDGDARIAREIPQEVHHTIGKVGSEPERRLDIVPASDRGGHAGSDGDVVVVNTSTDRIKYRHLQREPRVSIVVIDASDSTRYVSVTGIAELTQEGAKDHMYALGKKYVTEPEQLEAYNEVVRATGDIRALVRVTPTHVTYWNVD